MHTFALTASTRNQGNRGQLRSLRLSGKIPAVYYGRGQTPRLLDLDYQQFRKVFEKAGENTIIELSVDSEKMPVLVHDIQFDPVADTIRHIDFIHVDMTKEVSTSVKVTITGISPAVKNMGGILDVQKHEIKIKCLPKDLIHEIVVDVSGIIDFRSSVHVKDLNVPGTVKVLDNPEDTVVTATPPKAEEEAKPAEAAPAAEGVEGAAVAGAPGGESGGAGAPEASGGGGAKK